MPRPKMQRFKQGTETISHLFPRDPNCLKLQAPLEAAAAAAVEVGAVRR